MATKTEDQGAAAAVQDEPTELIEEQTELAQVEPDDHDPDDDDGDEEPTAKRDSELDAAQDDAAREAIRERRRNENRMRKQRRREKLESLERKNAMLEAQLRDVAGKVQGLESTTLNQSMATLDEEIRKSEQAARHFTTLAADAVAKQNGVGWQQAQERADFAKQRLAQLQGLKNNVHESARRQQTQASPVDPEVSRRASAFVGKHSWYRGERASDMDSRVLTQIDQGLINEGWDPRSDEYYEELEARMSRYLPHRLQSGANTNRNNGTNQRRQPVAGSNSGTAPGQSGFRLSSDQVQAMKDAGYWNDPKKREGMTKRYMEEARTKQADR